MISPHTFHVHVIFLRPATLSKSELAVEDTKLGISISTTRVPLSQESKEMVVACVP